ncbi:ATP-binding protein [soil metagenome]
MPGLRRLSIRWRITIGSVLIAAILLSGAVLVFRLQVATIITGTTKTLLMHDADPYRVQIQSTPDEAIDTPSRGQIVAVVDPSSSVKESNLPHSLRQKLDRLLALPSGSPHTVTGGDDRYRVLKQTVPTTGGDWFVVTARNEESGELLLSRLTGAMIVGAIILVLAFGIASWLLTGASLRPVTRMRRQAAALVARGSTEPLPLGPASDELSALATTLNEFIAEVQRSVSRERLAVEGERNAVDRERQLVSDASHELRTPLAILRTQLELAHLSSGDASALEAQIVMAERSVARLSSIATGLLELSQLEQASAPARHSPFGELEVELVAAIDRARLLAAAKAVTVDYEVEGAHPSHSYAIDAVGFGRLLGNLTSNAIRAVSDDGRVTVSLRQDDAQVLLTVADSGPGMPASFLPIAFDRFTRPDDSRASHDGGSGLGLAIVHAAVSAAGGTVALENTDGGFVVRVVLPAVR